VALPKHLAIIMDGNGRWAKLQGHKRVYGHVKGAQVAKNLIEACAARGLPYLTLFAFSTENWLRPQSEVLFLMKLLKKQLSRERDNLIKNNIQFRTIGQIDKLPIQVQSEIVDTIEATQHCTGMKLTFALSYGGRQEIVAAAKELAKDISLGKLTMDSINENVFASYLETSFAPDPDLILRTSGEHRLSNFMLWSSAYSELFMHPKLWPDFTEEDLDDILLAYSNRQRRFGKIEDIKEPKEDSDRVLNA
jgi:undecaprenyl diphosphate synthase